MKPSDAIQKQIDLARPRSLSGQTHPDNAHSSYEDGVMAALEWVLDMESEAPMDDE